MYGVERNGVPTQTMHGKKVLRNLETARGRERGDGEMGGGRGEEEEEDGSGVGAGFDERALPIETKTR